MNDNKSALKLISRLSTTLKFTAIASSIAVLSSSVVANKGDDYHQENPEGWYWYDDPRLSESLKPKEDLEVEGDALNTLSNAWLKANYPKILERAVDNPINADGSPSKDIVAVMYMQKVILNEAKNLSAAAHQEAELDPLSYAQKVLGDYAKDDLAKPKNHINTLN